VTNTDPVAIDGQSLAMKLLRVPSTLLSTIALILTSIHPSQAAPGAVEMVLEPDDANLQNSTLDKRWGCQYGACGVEQTICCNTGAGAYCSTDAADIAYCITGAQQVATTPPPAAPTGGYYTYWTVTTYETDTVMTTYVYSSWIAATTQQHVQVCPMDWAGMTTVCGTVCCATSQYCNAGTCTSNGAAYTVTGGGATAGTRGTSVTGAIITSTITPTVTTGFGTPAPISSGNATVVPSHSGGLSGGAIAGIVLGVIFGLILLFLICLCLCLRWSWDAVMSLFGRGRRRRRRDTTIIEERVERRRRGGTVDSRRWYGEADRPSRTSVTRIEERRRTGGAGVGGWAAGLGLGGLAATLGFRGAEDDRRSRRDDKTETDISYDSYDSYEYYSGEPRETVRLVEQHDSDN